MDLSYEKLEEFNVHEIIMSISRALLNHICINIADIFSIVVK